MRGKTQVPADWQVVRLGDVASLRTKQVNPLDSDSSPYVALENIASGGSLNGHGKAADSISNKTAFRRGDTLYGKLRPNLRKVVRVDFDGICSTDILAVAPTDETAGHFLGHLLRSDMLHGHAMRGVAGTKMPRTSWAHLREFRFRCPQLGEQQAIAAVLDSIDEAIKRTEAVIVATERLRDALLHELLTLGVPGWHSEWKEAPGIGTIPACWEAVRLGEVAEVNPRRAKLNVALDSHVTFLPMSAIADNLQGIIERDSRPFREVAKGYTYFEDQDVLFSKITPCLQNGKHTVALNLRGGFGFGTTEFHVVRSRDRIKSGYLYRFITQPHIIRHCANSFTGTAGQQRVQPETLRALRLALPPLPEQQAIATVMDSVDDAIDGLREELDSLQTTKASSADALLAGRVRAPIVTGETNDG